MAREVKRAKREDEKLEASDIFSAMPPVESLKALVSYIMSDFEKPSEVLTPLKPTTRAKASELSAPGRSNTTAASSEVSGKGVVTTTTSKTHFL